MGGGGFMQHASDTNRKDRAQKAARRVKFNGNHSDKMMSDSHSSTKMDFSHLSPEQIIEERKRIKTRSDRKFKLNLIVLVVSIGLLITAAIWTYSYLKRLF